MEILSIKEIARIIDVKNELPDRGRFTGLQNIIREQS